MESNILVSTEVASARCYMRVRDLDGDERWRYSDSRATQRLWNTFGALVSINDIQCRTQRRVSDTISRLSVAGAVTSAI